ncbi:MAG: reactive intermediate/imine deaminase [Lentisphaerae bacterium]|nr:reactive intermediate/imine deaminase [Lentisphaerota bacterium]
MMMTIATREAPEAVGPYAQAIRADGWVFCSGQLGLDPAGGPLAADTVAQARQALANLRSVLDAAGSGLDAVVKTTVFLTDLADFAAVNAVYAEAFGAHRPARACVQVAALPKGAKVEIEAVARVRAGA